MKSELNRALTKLEKAQCFWWWFNGIRTRNEPIIINIEE